MTTKRRIARLILVMLLAPLGSACATTLEITDMGANDRAAMALLSQRGPSGGTVLAARDTMLARTFRVDSTRVVGSTRDGVTFSYPIGEVDAIVFRDRGKAAREGLWIGVAVAVVVGIVSAARYDINRAPEDPFDTRVGQGVLRTFETTVWSTSGGFLLGFLVGHRTRVEFPRGH